MKITYQKTIHVVFITLTTLFACYIYSVMNTNIQYSKELKEHGIITTATVTSRSLDAHGDSWVFWFEFTDLNQEKKRGKTNYSNGDKNQYLKGDKLEVIYLMNNPEKARLNNTLALNSGYLGYLFVIVIFVCNGVTIIKHKEVKRFLTPK